MRDCHLGKKQTVSLFAASLWLAIACIPFSYAGDVTGKVRVDAVAGECGPAHAAERSVCDPSGVVLSLTPLDPARRASLKKPPVHAALVQKNKSFVPHLLVIPPGSTVDFPNRDPFFHNVFSLFEGKRFDLGLYESGASRSVNFDRAGVSYIFCNIHPQMNAIVISLDTPYYAIVGHSGEAKIPNVEPGEYLLQIWAEGLNREEMDKLSRNVKIGEAPLSVGTVDVPATETLTQHKNKYGRGYDATSSAPYEPH
jgi:plastocyanin